MWQKKEKKSHSNQIKSRDRNSNPITKKNTDKQISQIMFKVTQIMFKVTQIPKNFDVVGCYGTTDSRLLVNVALLDFKDMYSGEKMII